MTPFFQIKVGRFNWGFDRTGLPCHIGFNRRNLLKKAAALSIEDGNGNPVTLFQKDMPCVRKSKLGAVLVEFEHLVSPEQPLTMMTLQHEIFPDGTIFTDAFFTDRAQEDHCISRFELEYHLDFSDCPHVRWALFNRPKKVDGTLIQTGGHQRGLQPGVDRCISGKIMPLVSFNVRTSDGPTFYTEMFMEGDNVLSRNPVENESSVTWVDGSPVLKWNFQTAPVKHSCVPLQWRNRWGLVIAPAPVTRNHPPLVMYHYQDNFKHLPGDDELQAIADNGADVLAIHECWRVDAQNGGVPFDEKRFREVIDFAHKHNIRVCPYMRGNESSVLEYDTGWFDKYLQRDFDGLYMDYGGPFHYSQPPAEGFQGGRILFRKHYIACINRRKTVGKNGLILSHTGPSFSAIGMTGGMTDCYVSGEGERGVMIRSREDHAYFAMTSVCGSSLWTAAFPEYQSSRIVPALAATGQMPHSPLGLAGLSSSLSHPPAPGINDVNFRPLWKIWRLMKQERNLRIFNDYNSCGVFQQRADLSHYLMISGKKAVCIFANFTGENLTFLPEINWKKIRFSPGKKVYLCLPDIQSPGKAQLYRNKPITLPAWGVGAIVCGITDFSEFEKPYPALCGTSLNYLKEVDEQRKMRLGDIPGKWKIRLVLPLKVSVNTYEESLIADLYNTCYYLVKNDEKFSRIFALDKDSGWVDIETLTGKGKHRLGVRSFYVPDGEPFYSFVKVLLKEEEKNLEYELLFRNELEDDRSCLTFDVTIS